MENKNSSVHSGRGVLVLSLFGSERTSLLSGKIGLSSLKRKGNNTMRHFVDKVWVDEYRIYARTKDGLMASYLFADWERLRNADQKLREDYYLSYSGIHWPQIDEDLSFEGMFSDAGLCERTMTEDSVCYIG